MEDKAAKKNFLKKQALANSISAAFKRAGIYAEGIPENDPKRTELRQVLGDALENLAQGYKRPPRKEKHCENIEMLANEITEQFKSSGVLHNNRFRIGIAQKALNLYLKYLWCLEEIEAPPHCPLDRLIIECAGERGGGQNDWTKLDNIHVYNHLIERCTQKACAEKLTLPQWELAYWNSIFG